MQAKLAELYSDNNNKNRGDNNFFLFQIDHQVNRLGRGQNSI